MNCHTLKFKIRCSTSLHVYYHSKFHAQSTATAIVKETARTYSRTYYIVYEIYHLILILNRNHYKGRDKPIKCLIIMVGVMLKLEGYEVEKFKKNASFKKIITQRTKSCSYCMLILINFSWNQYSYKFVMKVQDFSLEIITLIKVMQSITKFNICTIFDWILDKLKFFVVSAA